MLSVVLGYLLGLYLPLVPSDYWRASPVLIYCQYISLYVSYYVVSDGTYCILLLLIGLDPSALHSAAWCIIATFIEYCKHQRVVGYV